MDGTRTHSEYATDSDRVLSYEQRALECGDNQDKSDQFDAPAMQILDPRGDLRLRNEKYLFLVSSNVLVLSSSYFKRMLQAEAFEEGLVQPQATDPPTKTLADDDPISFGVMCKLLHFQEVSPPKDVKHLAAIADVCDYYGTERAISVHILAWIRSFEHPECRLTIQEIQRLLWVAYVFDLQHAFEVFSVRLAAIVDVQSVNAMELGMLPDTLHGELP